MTNEVPTAADTTVRRPATAEDIQALQRSSARNNRASAQQAANAPHGSGYVPAAPGRQRGARRRPQ